MARPVFMTIQKIAAAITVKIAAMLKLETAVTWIGLIRATIPKSKVEQITIEPIISPKISQFWFSFADKIEK